MRRFCPPAPIRIRQLGQIAPNRTMCMHSKKPSEEAGPGDCKMGEKFLIFACEKRIVEHILQL